MTSHVYRRGFLCTGARIGPDASCIIKCRSIYRPTLDRYVGRYVDRYIGGGVHKIHMIPPEEQSSSVLDLCNKACVYSRYADMENYFRRWLRGTLYALRTRNKYKLVSQLRRMLFEWQGNLQFISQSGFSFDSVFFSFTANRCFMVILKTSADTNAGQNDRLIHCIKNLHCYNLKPKIINI